MHFWPFRTSERRKPLSSSSSSSSSSALKWRRYCGRRRRKPGGATLPKLDLINIFFPGENASFPSLPSGKCLQGRKRKIQNFLPLPLPDFRNFLSFFGGRFQISEKQGAFSSLLLPGSFRVPRRRRPTEPAEPAPDPVPLLGGLGKVVQVPAARPHQGVLRRKGETFQANLTFLNLISGLTNAGNDVFASCSQIAIYFAWLGFYTGWLLPAAVVGVLVFLYGVATMYSNRIAIETCTEGHDVRKVYVEQTFPFLLPPPPPPLAFSPIEFSTFPSNPLCVGDPLLSSQPCISHSP